MDAGLDPGVLRAGGGLLGRPASQPREATGSPRPSAAPEELPGLYWPSSRPGLHRPTSRPGLHRPSSRPGLHRPRVVAGSPPAQLTAGSPLAQGRGRVSASPGSWPGLCRPSSQPGLHWPRVVAGSPPVQLTAGTGVPAGAEEALKDVRPQEPTLNAALGGVTEGACPSWRGCCRREDLVHPSFTPPPRVQEVRQGSFSAFPAAGVLGAREGTVHPLGIQ